MIFDGGPQPIEVTEAVLCEQFNCLPGDLDEQETDRLLRIVYARSVQAAFGKMKRNEKQSRAEALLIGEILKAKAAQSG